MKKLLCALLAGILLAAMPAIGAAEEIPTITYWVNLEFSDVLTSYDDIKPLELAQERLGINIEWQHPPVGQESEQFNLMVVSGELPDIIEYSWNSAYPGGAEAAIEDGVILELNEIIDTMMPNYKAYLEKYPEVEKMVLTDTESTMLSLTFTRRHPPARRTKPFLGANPRMKPSWAFSCARICWKHTAWRCL